VGSALLSLHHDVVDSRLATVSAIHSNDCRSVKPSCRIIRNAEAATRLSSSSQASKEVDCRLRFRVHAASELVPPVAAAVQSVAREASSRCPVVIVGLACW